MEVNLQVPFGSRGRSDFGKRETEGGEKACTPRTGPRGEADGADPSADFTDRMRKWIRGIFGRAAVAASIAPDRQLFLYDLLDLTPPPALRALAFFAARKNSYWIAQNTSNLATVYFEMGDFAQAQHYAERTLEQEEPQSYPYALFTLGQVRRAQARWDEAAVYFAHVRQIAQQNEDNFLLAQLEAEMSAHFAAPS